MNIKIFEDNSQIDRTNIHLTYLIVIISLLLSLFLTLSVYPFIFTADGGARWNFALSLLYSHEKVDLLLPPVQSLFMYIFYFFTNNYASYTFVQSFLMLLSICLLIKTLLKKRRFHNKCFSFSWFWLSIIFIAFPITSVFSVILTDSSGVIIGMTLSIYFLNKNIQYIEYKYVHFLYYVAIFFVFFILFGFRYNSIILAPVIFLIIIVSKKNKKRKTLETICLILSILLAYIYIPNKLELNRMQPESLGWAWEIVGIAKNSNSKEYLHILDFAGDTKEAIARYNPYYLNPIFWDNNPPLPARKIALPENGYKVKRIYFHIILYDTEKFLKQKLNTLCLVLGIKEPLLDIQRGIHYTDENTKWFGGVDTVLNKEIRDCFFESVNSIDFITMRPIILILLSGGFLILLKAIKDDNFYIYFQAYMIGLFYYSGFLINTQAMEFRYYAPTFFILFVILACCIVIFLDKILSRIFLFISSCGR